MFVKSSEKVASYGGTYLHIVCEQTASDKVEADGTVIDVDV
jgi:hypothetical protein